MTVHYRDDQVALYHGDALNVLPEIPDSSVDAVITDPPYALAFRGHHWDAMHPDPEIWRQCLRLLQPGAHLLSFGGTRTWHGVPAGPCGVGSRITLSNSADGHRRSACHHNG
jgi:predicted methyltransferase